MGEDSGVGVEKLLHLAMVLDLGTMVMVTGSETRSRVCTKLDVWAWAAQQALPDASWDTVAGKH